MPSLKKITTLRLDDEISEKLKVLAKKDDKSVNNYIEQILKKHIKEIETKNARTNSN